MKYGYPHCGLLSLQIVSHKCGYNPGFIIFSCKENHRLRYQHNCYHLVTQIEYHTYVLDYNELSPLLCDFPIYFWTHRNFSLALSIMRHAFMKKSGQGNPAANIIPNCNFPCTQSSIILEWLQQESRFEMLVF